MTKSTLIPPRTRGLFLSALVFSVFTNLLMLTGPLFMLQVYDRVLSSRSEETLVVLGSLVAVLYFFYWLLEFARARVMARIGARIQISLSETVFRSVLDQTARRQERQTAKLQDLESIRNFFSAPIVLALLDLPWTPFFLAAIYVFHPSLGLFAFAGALTLVAIALANQILTHQRSIAANSLSALATNFTNHAEVGAELIQAQGMGPAITKRWQKIQQAALDQAIGANDWTGSFAAFAKAFRLFLQSAILAVGAFLVLYGEITAGAMVAASIILGRALAPVDMALAGWPVAQRARIGWRNLKQLTEATFESKETTTLPKPEARLSVRDVTISLSRGEKPILRRVSFDLEPGEALGIIGRSGGGKSTLAKCLVGILPPMIGEVRLGGATLDQFGVEQLGLHIGYLPQETHLFPGTIAENIAQMSETPDSNKVIRAAQRAGVHDVILDLREGYDTKIDGSTSNLSGGQRQRIALARALYNDPVLLVLDEPNSALDAEGSEALNSVIEDMKEAGLGVVIMTHRPTAISVCDRLLILDKGAVSARGPRDDVIRSMMKNAGEVYRVIERSAS